MPSIFSRLIWAGIAIFGAFCLGGIAIGRGEPVNSMWLVLAAVCTYLIGFRFYAKFIATKVIMLDNDRATPAERLRNGHDFEPTNKWIVFGHHFAAIAGPGPLVGPTLAAQFGYLPGTLWIIVGAVLGGAIQDYIILYASMRRDGKSLGQMAREEIGRVGGFTALLTVLLIMIILLAVVALVVVNALKGSPWGTFTIAATMPIVRHRPYASRMVTTTCRPTGGSCSAITSPPSPAPVPWSVPHSRRSSATCPEHSGL